MRLVPALWLAALGLAAACGESATEPVRVAAGDYYAPQFSPNGAELLVTGPRSLGLSTIDIDSGDARTVTHEPRAGVTAHYLADGRVAFQAVRAGAARTLAIDADGTEHRLAEPRPRAFAHGDRIYVRGAAGITAVGTGDRFFAPRVSPDGTRVVFLGLATGIHVYDIATGTLAHLGAGTAPAWAPDSRTLAFERTEDDGQVILGSDIWLWRPGANPAPLMITDSRIERRPSWSPDGRMLAFDDDRGAIYIVSAEVAQ